METTKKSAFMPLVSVIIPVYNVEMYLEKCLISVLRQTWKCLDIILVDDGSSDSSGKICDRYAESDRRVRVFHTENQGLSVSRNLGLQKANETNSEFIAFIDGDDWLEPNMIETMIKSAVATNADIVSCNELFEYDHKSIIREYNGIPCQNGETACTEILRGRISDHLMSKIWKKHCFNNYSFPIGRVYEDIATVYKVVYSCTIFVSIKDVLYHYRIRSDSISHTDSLNNAIDLWLAHRERVDFLHTNPCVDNFALQDYCKQQCVLYAGWVWRICFKASAKELNKYNTQIRFISRWIKTQTPLAGNPSWLISNRILSLFTRFNNKTSFFVVFIIHKIWLIMQKRKNKAFQ